MQFTDPNTKKFNDFYNHIFACPKCTGASNKYCDEGKKLKDAYDKETSERLSRQYLQTR